MVGNIYSVETVDKGMEQDGVRFHHTTQHDALFKTYEVYIWNFLFNILEHS